MTRSPGVPADTAERFIDLMKEAGSGDRLFRSTFGVAPMLWEPDRLRMNRLERVSVYSAEEDSEAPLVQNRIQFKCPGPDLESELPLGVWPTWAVEIDLHDYYWGSELAQVFPPGMTDITGLLGAIGRSRVSTSADGLVVRCSRFDTTQYWSLPTGQKVFHEWFATKGVDTRTSSSGQTTLEVLRAIEGPIRAGLLAYPDLIRTLDRAAEGHIEDEAATAESPRIRGHVIPYNVMRQVLGQANPGDEDRAVAHAGALAELDVIRPLARLDCPHCGQRNWYGPAELDLTVRCERCLREFRFPAELPPDRSRWGYRPVGPFTALGCAHGAYTVALCLRFFNSFGMSGERHTWCVGVESTDEAGIEIDFGIWHQSDRMDREPASLVLGEAKTFNTFEPKDFRRAGALLKQYPDSFAVFATLRDSLIPEERKRLANLLRSGGRSGFHPNEGRIIVLTELELCGDVFLTPTYAWRDRGGKYAEVAERFEHLRDLRGLSAATMQLYVGADLAPA